MELVSLFYIVDEFCKGFEAKPLAELRSSAADKTILAVTQ